MIRNSFLTAIAVAVLPVAAMAETALPVEIVTVHAAPNLIDHRFVGRIEAANSFPGAFRASGRITEITVETGDHVPAGSVIARLDATQATAAVAGAQAGLAAAEASLRQAEQARDRARNLLDRGAGTQSQLDAAEQAFLTAQAGHNQAAARLETTMQALEDTIIRTNNDLIVLDKLAQSGEIVGPGQEVLTLATDGRLEALFLSPDMAGLEAMRGVKIELQHGDGPPVETEITEISPVLTSSGTVEVRAEIPPDTAADWTIGNTVKGHVNAETTPVHTVPWTALSATRNGPAVWTVTPETMAVHLNLIVIESYDDAGIAVSEGLSDGMLVVGAGSQALYEGKIVTQAGENQ
ncbi:putative efflux pump membrane fusion protein [Thalassovita gelatinovora]|uniref:Putative efflux pump membrane fusion protein n=1 Tax=Thalassovita gelatinovora TaxID=53501 RepID=A0A0P1F9R1_THAGE|nr:efflux RND transporter periplasmic adaptor subunit [Thalassovita gelatinovora]QIZ81314.1 efflux RND transporter periplasmic adaptor subunit [Thalassovita gelatinovora]CUH64520.1 putative efflux pump membrane fusion protein [Thalassovita gelatinovora]SEP96996.1 RND family efflux transporter, MFP subunit [Thalassovita gelatinovora]